MKLWIIGNGFDLQHGLKTRYADYKIFLCQQYACEGRKDTIRARQLPWEVCPNCCKNNFKKRHCPVLKFTDLPRRELKKDLWRELEEACSFDLDAFFKRLDGWSKEAEPPIGESATDIRMHDDLDFAKVFTGDDFYKWFLKNEEDVRKKKEKDQLTDAKGTDVFLTFNYTSTLQRIYAVPDDRIHYVHGRIKDVEDKSKEADILVRSLEKGHIIHSCLVFGSTELTDESIKAAISQYTQVRHLTEDQVSNISNLLTSLVKPFRKEVSSRVKEVERFIARYCDGASPLEEVVVAGHSLGEIDMPYFDCLTNHFRYVKWRFLYYSEDDLKQALDFCKKYRIDGYYVPWSSARKTCYDGVPCYGPCGLPCQGGHICCQNELR